MKHCVVAVKREDEYISVVCHYDEELNIGDILCDHYNTHKAAESLIRRGDLHRLDQHVVKSFFQSLDYSWNETCPVLHCSFEMLNTYCQSIDAACLYLFEGGVWSQTQIDSVNEQGQAVIA